MTLVGAVDGTKRAVDAASLLLSNAAWGVSEMSEIARRLLSVCVPSACDWPASEPDGAAAPCVSE